MHTVYGTVTSGFGVAARHLAHVVPLISARTGLAKFTPGTLNVRLPASFLVEPDAVVTTEEYDGNEYLKLQRCVIHGFQAVIVRPHLHETIPGWGHGPSHLELVSAVHLRSALKLDDGAVVGVEIGGDADWWARARPRAPQLFTMRVQRYVRRRLLRAA